MSDSERPPLPASQYRANTLQVVLVPILFFIGAAISIAGLSQLRAEEGFLAWIIAGVLTAPVLTGFVISLIWRSKFKPIPFFFVGAGMSIASALTFAALLFGTCVAMGAFN